MQSRVTIYGDRQVGSQFFSLICVNLRNLRINQRLPNPYFASLYTVARDTPMCAAAISAPRRISR